MLLAKGIFANCLDSILSFQVTLYVYPSFHRQSTSTDEMDQSLPRSLIVQGFSGQRIHSKKCIVYEFPSFPQVYQAAENTHTYIHTYTIIHAYT